MNHVSIARALSRALCSHLLAAAAHSPTMSIEEIIVTADFREQARQ